MKTRSALLLAIWALAAGTALASPVTYATDAPSMVGDSVNIAFDNYGYSIVDYGNFEVQPGVGHDVYAFNFTFDATSIRMGLRSPNSNALSLYFLPDEFDRFLLSSIDTPNDPFASIAGVTIRSINGVSNFDADDIVFTDHGIALSMVDTRWAGYGEVVFDLHFQTTAEPEGTVPEPGTLALAGMALLGLGASCRRRRQDADGGEGRPAGMLAYMA